MGHLDALVEDARRLLHARHERERHRVSQEQGRQHHRHSRTSLPHTCTARDGACNPGSDSQYWLWLSLLDQTYIKQCRRLYDLLHIPKQVFSNADDIIIDSREILKWFDDWRAALEAAHGAEFKRFFISEETFFDMQLCVNGIGSAMDLFFSRYGKEKSGPFLVPKRFSQNALEGFFGFVRTRSFSGSVSGIQYGPLVNSFQVARTAAAASKSLNYGRVAD